MWGCRRLTAAGFAAAGCGRGRGLGDVYKRQAVGVGVLFKDEKVFYKLVLALAGAEAVEASQLGSIGGGGGEHDGLVAMS